MWSIRALSLRFMVINLGNLMSVLLDEAMMECLMQLCKQHNLILLADEVYQLNLHMHNTHLFTSFKKVICALAPPSFIPLCCLHSL